MPLNHSSSYSQLTDKQYTAIGRVAVEWSNIEHLLGILLCRLLMTPEFPGRTYTDLLSAAALQNAVIEAISIQRLRYGCRIVPEERLSEIETLLGQITKLRSERNRIAHFCWARSSDEAVFGTSFSGGLPNTKKHKKSVAVLTLKDLERLYLEMHKTTETMMGLIKKIPEIEEEQVLTLCSRETP